MFQYREQASEWERRGDELSTLFPREGSLVFNYMCVCVCFGAPMRLIDCEIILQTERRFEKKKFLVLQGAPAEGSQQQQNDDLVWPVAVLFGSGDVFIVVPPHFSPTA